MQFLKRLLNTKRPSFQLRLDIAMILTLIPHLFVLKLFMFVYLFIVLVYFKKEKFLKKDTAILIVIGLICVTLSFFSSYNFSDFSRMQFFVSFISSLLILALTLQRLTREITVYLKASPAMLMLLSFFFFDTISMLFYSIFVFFVLILLSIWNRMDAPLKDVLRFNTRLFLLSLPAVMILFIAFPRIAFDKADFGFKGDNYSHNGYDGSMYVSDKEFIGSKKIVFEVTFHNGMPPEEKLYFRGSTLYMDTQNEWKESSVAEKEKLSSSDAVIEYDLTMYPHGKKWLYPLDIPMVEQKHTKLKNDYTLESEKNIYEMTKYAFRSVLNYTLRSESLDDSLQVDASDFAKFSHALESIKEQSYTQEQKVKALFQFFFSQKLAYTTKPKGLDIDKPIESFLFDAKEGYCTHYASSFAIGARLLGIPSRVVTGYKANYKGRIENYLVVKQEDAHAWVELYLDKRGWVRFDPTGTAFTNLDNQRVKKKLVDNELFQKLNLQYMYVKYIITNWILDFDRLKQMDILKSLLNDTIYLLQFIFSILGIAFISFLLVYLLRQSKPKNKSEKMIQKLLKELERKGVLKKKNEPMQSFLQRAEKELGISLKDINREYHLYKYANNGESFLRLEEAIKELKKIQKTKHV